MYQVKLRLEKVPRITQRRDHQGKYEVLLFIFILLNRSKTVVIKKNW